MMQMLRYASHACAACRTTKRKCDRVLPSCSACAARFKRFCVYDETSGHHSSTQPVQSLFPSTATYSSHSPSTIIANVDYFRHESLRHGAVGIIASGEVQRVLRSTEEVATMASAYFRGVHLRLPILSREHFTEGLPTSLNALPADLGALCLAMHLVQQRPQHRGQSMQSSLYVTTKMLIALLEASSHTTLRVVQSRLLVCWYEIGHGLFSNVCVSIAACARAAYLIGLHERSATTSLDSREAALEEERMRTWWAICNLDRFISFCYKGTVLCTEDPHLNDQLPCADVLWVQNVQLPSERPTLATPHDVSMGQFARECQIIFLAGRVIRHVYDPATDALLQEEEKSQLERTLLAYLPVLDRKQLEFGRYCASFAICSVALMTLYGLNKADEKSASRHTNDFHELAAMEEVAFTVYQHEQRCSRASDGLPDDSDIFSPYVPLSIYMASFVQQTCWKQRRNPIHYDAAQFLTQTLESFACRWANADFYSRALQAEHPTLLPEC